MALTKVHNRMINGSFANVLDFGAVGDGVTDDTAAVQAALNQTGTVYVPKGSYKITSTITLSSNTTLVCEGTFVWAVAANLFECSGSEDSQISMSGSTTAPNIVNVATGTLAAGDYIRIASDEIFDDANTDSTVGEINIVDEITSGTALTTRLTLQDNYLTSDNGYVSKITFKENIRIEGIKIIRTVGTLNEALLFTLAKNVIIENADINANCSAAIRLSDSIDCVVSDSFVTTGVNDTSYGVSVRDAAQDIIIKGNNFYDCRHALSTNNTTTTDGIPRRITFTSNNVRYSSLNLSSGVSTAIDTHGAAEYIYITDNFCESATGSGINIECPTANVQNNIILNAGGSGIIARNESDRNGSIIISGNEIVNCANEGIELIQGTRGTTAKYRNCVVSDNKISDSGSIAIDIEMALSNGSTITVTGNTCSEGDPRIRMENVVNFICSNNAIRNLASGSAMDFVGCSDGCVNGNSVFFPSASTATGIDLNSCVDVVVNSNVVSGDVTSGYGIFLADTSNHILMVGNNVREHGNDGTGAIRLGTGADNTKANNLES